MDCPVGGAVVSDASVSDISVDETFFSFNDFSFVETRWTSLLITWFVKFYFANSPEPWLAMRFAAHVTLDAATSDGNSGGMSTDCQIFPFVPWGSATLECS